MALKISSPSKLYPTTVDLTDCDKEPIHIIGKIQNHGVLLACTIEDKVVTHASDNTKSLFGKDASGILDKSIYTVIEKNIVEELFKQLEKKSSAHKEVTLHKQSITILAHRSGDLFVLEFEINTITLNPFNYQIRLAETASEINDVSNLEEKYQSAASSIKKYLGYDRVMIYQFDAEWNGDIVAEEREEHLESWLGLRFPASDIPQQARQLFLKQGVRIVNDVISETVAIIPSKNQRATTPVDLSRSELRAVSPIHIEYLCNMEVAATLTVAIIHDNLLWGLIACHHYSPKYINFYQRLGSKFLAQVLATSIHLSHTGEVLEQLKKSAITTSSLIDQINLEKDISRGLSAFEITINDLTDSHGSATYISNKITTTGKCPADKDIVKLIEKIRTLTDTQIYYTHRFKSNFEEADAYRAVASGVFCLFISTNNNDALLWFKPEVIRTVNWAGIPDKKVTINQQQRLSPRKSFEKWSTQQQGTSEHWENHEISEGVSLQKSIQDIIIASYDEIKKLNDRLQVAYEELESFSYSISHDLRGPLRGIDGFAHILKEDYYDNLDDFGKSSVDTIISSTTKMNLLIDDILEYSSLGRTEVEYRKFQINDLIREFLPELKLTYNNVEVVVESNLPDLFGDRIIVLILVNNLLENAMKYSSKVTNPKVTVGCLSDDTFFIKDNGIGFDMKHHKQIFGVFDRLVSDEYPGSGIGLAIVRRVINKHEGEVWVESQKDRGSTFYFRLTKNEN